MDEEVISLFEKLRGNHEDQNQVYYIARHASITSSVVYTFYYKQLF